MPTRPRPPGAILGSHIILMGYGHWLPNDPRGSASTIVTSEPLRALGPTHPSKRSTKPSEVDLRSFHEQASRALLHPVLWFESAHCEIIAQAIKKLVIDFGYTCWALSILRNHIHVVIRTHRDRTPLITDRLMSVTRDALHESNLAPRSHPIWNGRPHWVFIRSSRQLEQCVHYVEQNPVKAGLLSQRWSFVRRRSLL